MAALVKAALAHVDDSVPGPVPGYEIPKGNSELAWLIAAAWADVPVEDLLADTAPVKSTHYMAGLRVSRVFSQWLDREDATAEQCIEAGAAVGDPLAEAVLGDAGVDEDSEYGNDPFCRVMLMAEDTAWLTTRARDRGDAVRAAQFSSIETSLLQVAAGLQEQSDRQQKVKGQ